MTQIGFPLLVLFVASFFLSGSAEPTSHQQHSRARVYLEAQCRVTRYPRLCFECLSTNRNTSTLQGPQELAQIALMASLIKARYTKAFVSEVAKQFVGKKARDLQAVKDCLDQINDGVDQITQSITELKRMGRDGEEQFVWHESNVQSWVSAALTDATTCLDGFSGHAVGSKVKAMIKAKVLNMALLTSNMLALFNRFTMRHRASHALKNP